MLLEIKGAYIIFWIQVSRRGGLPQPILFLSKLSISEHSGSIGIKKGEKSPFLFFWSAKEAEGGGQSLADMSAEK